MENVPGAVHFIPPEEVPVIPFLNRFIPVIETGIPDDPADFIVRKSGSFRSRVYSIPISCIFMARTLVERPKRVMKPSAS